MSKLAEWFIQLATKGKPQVEKDIDDTKKKLDEGSASASKFEKFIGRAFLGAAASMTAFVRSGLQGTAIATQLSYAFEGFTQQVVSLFKPGIELAIEVIQSLTGWLERLGGQGQAAILALGAAIAASVAIATGGISAIGSAIVLAATAFYKLAQATEGGRTALAKIQGVFDRLGDRLAPALAKLGARLGELFSQFAESQVFDGIIWALEKTLNLTAILIEANLRLLETYRKIYNYVTGTQGAREAYSGSSIPRSDVGGRMGGSFSGPNAVFSSIQKAALAADPVKRLVSISEQQLKQVEEINKNTHGMKPAFV